MGGLIILLKEFLISFLNSFRSNRGILFGIVFLFGKFLATICPILVALIRTAISRQREYLADASGAMIIRDPIAIADALEKLLYFQRNMENVSTATAHLFIVNPLGEDKVPVSGLFDTHPPLEDRIKRLRSLVI